MSSRPCMFPFSSMGKSPPMSPCRAPQTRARLARAAVAASASAPLLMIGAEDQGNRSGLAEMPGGFGHQCLGQSGGGNRRGQIEPLQGRLEFVEVADVLLQKVLVGQPGIENHPGQGARQGHFAPRPVAQDAVGIAVELDAPLVGHHQLAVALAAGLLDLPVDGRAPRRWRRSRRPGPLRPRPMRSRRLLAPESPSAWRRTAVAAQGAEAGLGVDVVAPPAPPGRVSGRGSSPRWSAAATPARRWPGRRRYAFLKLGGHGTQGLLPAGRLLGCRPA